jgi:hypothetical protein
MSVYAEETYDVYNEARVKARKEHTCGACKEPICRGHTYWRIGIVFERQASSLRRCERCQAMHVHLRGLGDCDTWPDEQLSCGHGYEEMWEEPPPPEIAELAFLTAEEMQRRAGAKLDLLIPPPATD